MNNNIYIELLSCLGMPKFEIILKSESGSIYKIEDMLTPKGAGCHSMNRVYYKINKENKVIEKFSLNGAIYFPYDHGKKFHEDVIERNSDRASGGIMYWGIREEPFTPKVICRQSFFEGYLLDTPGRIYFLKNIKDGLGEVFRTGKIREIIMPDEYRTIQERAVSMPPKIIPLVRDVSDSFVNDIQAAVKNKISTGGASSSNLGSKLFLKKKK